MFAVIKMNVYRGHEHDPHHLDIKVKVDSVHTDKKKAMARKGAVQGHIARAIGFNSFVMVRRVERDMTEV